MKKLIFYKDWNQIGCKAFSLETTEDNMIQWLQDNHPNTLKFRII